MLIYLLRHGLTEYNAQKRYQGQRDIPLSPEGLAQLRRADIDPKIVYISTLQRTRQTAEVLFPDAELVPVDGLKALADGEEMLVILAHGGTQMAALERYGVPRRSYYRWCGPNAGGYVLDARDWAARYELRLVKTVQYTKESTC